MKSPLKNREFISGALFQLVKRNNANYVTAQRSYVKIVRGEGEPGDEAITDNLCAVT